MKSWKAWGVQEEKRTIKNKIGRLLMMAILLSCLSLCYIGPESFQEPEIPKGLNGPCELNKVNINTIYCNQHALAYVLEYLNNYNLKLISCYKNLGFEDSWIVNYSH